MCMNRWLVRKWNISDINGKSENDRNIVLKRGEGARLLALSALKEIPGPRSALLYAHVLSLKSESSQVWDASNYIKI